MEECAYCFPSEEKRNLLLRRIPILNATKMLRTACQGLVADGIYTLGLEPKKKWASRGFEMPRLNTWKQPQLSGLGELFEFSALMIFFPAELRQFSRSDCGVMDRHRLTGTSFFSFLPFSASKSVQFRKRSQSRKWKDTQGSRAQTRVMIKIGKGKSLRMKRDGT